jgi:DNA-binding response OmpR family regulator
MRRKILVVDDDTDLVQLLAFNFKAAGYAVGTASDGVEALKKARSLKPDLILLDLMLPELDGFAVCEILRQSAATASVPIVLLTARSGEIARYAGLEAGATDYVTKPFSPAELVARINAILQHPAIQGNAPTAGAGPKPTLPLPNRNQFVTKSALPSPVKYSIQVACETEDPGSR